MCSKDAYKWGVCSPSYAKLSSLQSSSTTSRSWGSCRREKWVVAAMITWQNWEMENEFEQVPGTKSVHVLSSVSETDELCGKKCREEIWQSGPVFRNIIELHFSLRSSDFAAVGLWLRRRSSLSLSEVAWSSEAHKASSWRAEGLMRAFGQQRSGGPCSYSSILHLHTTLIHSRRPQSLHTCFQQQPLQTWMHKRRKSDLRPHATSDRQSTGVHRLEETEIEVTENERQSAKASTSGVALCIETIANFVVNAHNPGSSLALIYVMSLHLDDLHHSVWFDKIMISSCISFCS